MNKDAVYSPSCTFPKGSPSESFLHCPRGASLMLPQISPDVHADIAVRQTTVLKGIGAALPPHLLSQNAVLDHARRMLAPKYPFFEALVPAFENAGVDRRYGVMPLEWFSEDHGWADRGAAYMQGAVAMFIGAATDALDAAGLTAAEVDTIVTVSSTGIATPTLEAQAHKVMGFRRDVRRVPVFGLGCAGGVSGLSIARRLAAADPGSTVLMVGAAVKMRAAVSRTCCGCKPW